MDKGTLVNVIVSLLLVVGVLQAVELNSLARQTTGGVSLASAPATQASGGETYEQMMARMHPDQVQPAQSAPSSALSQLPNMVGGC